MKAVIIMGSTSDEPHAKKITDKLDEYGITWEQYAASAHKEPLKVLDELLMIKYENRMFSRKFSFSFICICIKVIIFIKYSDCYQGSSLYYIMGMILCI